MHLPFQNYLNVKDGIVFPQVCYHKLSSLQWEEDIQFHTDWRTLKLVFMMSMIGIFIISQS